MVTARGPEFGLFEGQGMQNGRSCRKSCSDFRWTEGRCRECVPFCEGTLSGARVFLGLSLSGEYFTGNERVMGSL